MQRMGDHLDTAPSVARKWRFQYHQNFKIVRGLEPFREVTLPGSRG
jgi:hypothetical protein